MAGVGAQAGAQAGAGVGAGAGGRRISGSFLQVTPPPGEVPYDHVLPYMFDYIEHVWYKQASGRFTFLLQPTRGHRETFVSCISECAPFYGGESWRLQELDEVNLVGWTELADFTPRGERASLEVFVNHFADGREPLKYDRNVFAPILDQLGVPSSSETRRFLQDADVTESNVCDQIVEMTLRYKVVHILLRTHGACWADGGKEKGYFKALAMHGEGERMTIETLFLTLRGTPAHVVLLLDVCGVGTCPEYFDPEKSDPGYERLSVISASEARGTTSGNILLGAVLALLAPPSEWPSLLDVTNRIENEAMFTWDVELPEPFSSFTDDTPLDTVLRYLKVMIKTIGAFYATGALPRGEEPPLVKELKAWLKRCDDMQYRGDLTGRPYVRVPRPRTGHIQDAVNGVWGKINGALKTTGALKHDDALPAWRLSNACVKDIRVFRTVFALPAWSANKENAGDSKLLEKGKK